ncbi:MAG: hypothetical protein IJK92_09820 [Bacteroidales bacterium]|nr:hypothetical protein [Bacteroidales bacterium]
MRKTLLTLVIVMTFSLCASAQSDGFFKNYRNDGYSDRGGVTSDPLMPNLPGGSVGEYTSDQGAPLGSGLLVLTALGAGYAVARRRQK